MNCKFLSLISRANIVSIALSINRVSNFFYWKRVKEILMVM